VLQSLQQQQQQQLSISSAASSSSKMQILCAHISCLLVMAYVKYVKLCVGLFFEQVRVFVLRPWTLIIIIINMRKTASTFPLAPPTAPTAPTALAAPVMASLGPSNFSSDRRSKLALSPCSQLVPLHRHHRHRL
jgi:hypothetical protein